MAGLNHQVQGELDLACLLWVISVILDRSPHVCLSPDSGGIAGIPQPRLGHNKTSMPYRKVTCGQRRAQSFDASLRS
jgi:hypothetical protein